MSRGSSESIPIFVSQHIGDFFMGKFQEFNVGVFHFGIFVCINSVPVSSLKYSLHDVHLNL